jgi:hypothetical protein
MIFFDYLYYRICKAYVGTGTSGSEFTAACIVSIMQGFNILSIIFFIGIIKHDKSIINKTFAVVLFFVFLVINYIRYVYRETNDYKMMSEKYSNETGHRTKGVLILLYIILSIGLTLVLAIYGGSHKY